MRSLCASEIAGPIQHRKVDSMGKSARYGPYQTWSTAAPQRSQTPGDGAALAAGSFRPALGKEKGAASRRKGERGLTGLEERHQDHGLLGEGYSTVAEGMSSLTPLPRGSQIEARQSQCDTAPGKRIFSPRPAPGTVADGLRGKGTG